MHDWVHSHSCLAVDRSEAKDSTCINKNELSFRWNPQWGGRPLCCVCHSVLFWCCETCPEPFTVDNFHNKSLRGCRTQKPQIVHRRCVNTSWYLWNHINPMSSEWKHIITSSSSLPRQLVCLFPEFTAVAWLHPLPWEVCWFLFFRLDAPVNSRGDSLCASSCYIDSPCIIEEIFSFTHDTGCIHMHTSVLILNLILFLIETWLGLRWTQRNLVIHKWLWY